MLNSTSVTCCCIKRYLFLSATICLLLMTSFCSADEDKEADEKRKKEDQALAKKVKAELKPIGSISIDITPPKGDLPGDASDDDKKENVAEPAVIPHFTGTSRPWMATSYAWEASNLRHQPLYFEEINTERHGYHCEYLQPAFSAFHFFGTVPILPYKIGAHCPDELQYTLGYYRAGSSVPLKYNCLPLSWRGALLQAGVTTGLFYAIP